MVDDKDTLIPDVTLPEKFAEPMEQLAKVLQMPPQPIAPEKRTWSDYFKRSVKDMLQEAIAYAKEVEHPEQLKGLVVLFNPSELNNPENLMAGTNSFEVHMDRVKLTDPEVIFLCRYVENDVFLHYYGVRGAGE